MQTKEMKLSYQECEKNIKEQGEGVSHLPPFFAHPRHTRFLACFLNIFVTQLVYESPLKIELPENHCLFTF